MELAARSGGRQDGPPDLHVVPTHVAGVSGGSKKGTTISINVAVPRPEDDSRGRITLASRDPRIPPKIEFGLLRNPKDLEKLADCVELARRIAATKPFSDYFDEELSPGPEVLSRDEIKSFLREQVEAYLHMTASAPMGVDDDPRAVVDQNGKVRRVDGLYTGDASIMPDYPHGGDQSHGHRDGRDRRRSDQGRSGEDKRAYQCQISGHQRAVAVIPVERDQAVELAARTESRERRKCSSPKPNRRERSEQYGK